MQNRTPVICDRCRARGHAGEEPFAALRPSLDFTPDPRKYRHDGWTPERQRAFIEALASTGSVKLAARAVNMSPEGAYYLRRQPGAEEFAAAWKRALEYGGPLIEEAALERTIHGVSFPIFHGDRQVGERRVHNERLTMFMLQHRMPEKYGQGLRSGTKHPDTIAREEADEIDEAREAEVIAVLDKLGAQYMRVVRAERAARREGDLQDAEFYARQMTHIELCLICGPEALILIKRAWRRWMAERDWPRPEPAEPDEFMTRWVAQLRHAALAQD